MSQPVRSITYNHENRDYTLYLNGEFVGFARTEFEGQVVLDRLVADLAVADRLAQVQADYATAKAEGRIDDARALKAEGKRLIAQRAGIDPDVFEQEHAQFVAGTLPAA